MRALILIAALLTPLPAAAQIFDRPRCDIRTQDLNFGPYSTLDQVPKTANTHVEVTCDQFVVVQLSVSDGSGSQLDRTMTRGRSDLHYNIYTDTSYNRVIGDGSGGTVAPVRIATGFGPTTFRFYGKIPSRQTVEAGRYDDSLRVSIEF